MKPAMGHSVLLEGYRICRGYGRELTVYEEHPSGERRLVGRCESMGGVKRFIRQDEKRRGEHETT